MDKIFNWMLPGPIDYTLESEQKRAKNVPYFLNPFAPCTAALPMSYFNVGIAMSILSTPITYYLISTLDISSTSYSAFATVVSLPWSLKFIFGMITDGSPIFQYRRKSWLFIGWAVYVGLCLYMSSLSEPSFTAVSVCMTLMTCSYLLADVCADASCVERARYEAVKRKGTLQTAAYTVRSFGMTIGAILGAILYNTATWGWGLTISQMFFLSACIPISGVFLFMWSMEEIMVIKVAPTFSEQLSSIWNTLQLWAVIRPVCFIYLYNVFQIPNQAWTNFLVEGLSFTDFEIGMITVASAILYYFGMVLFKAFFFETSWRNIYLYTTILGVIFSILQVLLVLRVNLTIGIPDFAFALGDTAIATLIAGIQFMPNCIMFVMLCPEGCEGVVYAMLTTISNVSGTVAADFGSAFTLIWSVDNATLEAGDFTGILYLTILTSCLQVFPLVFLWILPDTKAEMKALVESGVKWFEGGVALATVLLLSLILTIVLNIYWIWY